MGSYVYAPHNATYGNLYPKASHDGPMLKKKSPPATEKQIAFLNTLIAERVMADEVRAWLLAYIEAGSLSTRIASEQITSLLRAPKIVKQKTFVPKTEYVESEVGFYANSEGTFFEVVESKRGHKYAMELRPQGGGKYKWLYSPGAMKDFQQWEHVTAEMAQAFGKRTERCMVCARKLTNPDSKERGIGPICADKFGGI